MCPPPPARRALIGVWDGYFSGTAFGTFDAEFRYDHVAADGKAVELYRYDGTAGAWALQEAETLAGHRLRAAGLSAQGTAKIGLFAAAVSSAPPPTLLLIR